ncbi:ABC transporter substrate-binding protein [Streptomyces fractus]|uniref:ABC transporter substrate-binding protein n=1 Tax=Streptomyces fractus TaxID=641806 RepID=UPI003CF55FD7
MALATALLVGAAGCSGSGNTTTDAAAPAGNPQRGGSLTVLEDAAFAGSWPTGLDPATNTTGGANVTQMSAIYGGLFTLTATHGGKDAKITPNQAESYKLLDGGKTVKITLRKGITFSDGTAFDADAVAFNLRRALTANCTCKPTWPVAKRDAVTTEGKDTVVLHFVRPYGGVINNFPISNTNWIASPTALKKAGKANFKIKPVGAGPFTVASNKLSSELSLKRNPTYFKKGLPYLDNLTVKSIGGDQPAYQALLAGQAQAYEGLNTTPLLKQAQANKQLTTTVQPATSPYVVQLNTKKAPFDDKRAREAIYYASDFKAIAKGLFKGIYPVSQNFTAPGGLFYEPTVPGYREHDLAKAKKLVKQVGGITVELGTLGNYVAKQVMTALQTQWKEAGIKVTIKDYPLSTLIQQFNSGQWTTVLQTAGSWDPVAGVGVGFRFSSTSPYSGVKDATLDALLDKAATSTDQAERKQLYSQAGKRISDEAYAPFGLAFAPTNLAAKGVAGPGLTTKIPPMTVNTNILWDQVWRQQ